MQHFLPHLASYPQLTVAAPTNMFRTTAMRTKADELINLMACAIEQASELLGSPSESGFVDITELQANSWIHAKSHPSESEVESTRSAIFLHAPWRRFVPRYIL
jgi:hypothetical protein